jgi:hypothetical protein
MAIRADYIIGQLAGSLGDSVAVEDWRRIAAVVDYIAGTEAPVLAYENHTKIEVASSSTISLRVCRYRR